MQMDRISLGGEIKPGAITIAQLGCSMLDTHLCVSRPKFQSTSRERGEGRKLRRDTESASPLRPVDTTGKLKFPKASVSRTNERAANWREEKKRKKKKREKTEKNCVAQCARACRVRHAVTLLLEA